MDHITEGLKGVIAIHDDICVYGKTREEHDERLIALMRRATDKGLVFNSKKCQIRQQSITFYGAIFSVDGISPDPKKIQAIQDLPAPVSKKNLESFLGLIQYLSPHVPRLSEKTAFLRGFLKDDRAWDWSADDTVMFQAFKDWLGNHLLNSVLQYYNPQKDLTIQTDASEYGLGAALVQDEKPIAFASKSLTDTETRYANIEREMLAVCFALEKFHTFCYGRQVTVKSDHKPLETIQKKPIHAAPPRLQRMLLKNQRYDYDIQYLPGKEMVLADRLSRFPSRRENVQMAFDHSIDEFCLTLRIDYVAFTDPMIQVIKAELDKDPVLRTVYGLTQHGWPNQIRNCPRVARRFFSFRDELSTDQGLLIKGERLVIPESLRNRILSELHEGHISFNTMQKQAKSTVYWPGIEADCEAFARSCVTCIEHSNNERRSPMISRDVPDGPWIDIAADFFDIKLQGHTVKFLLIADYFSKYPFLFEMRKTTTELVIRRFENVFAQLGEPKTLQTDNGPQFASKEFEEYLQNKGIRHLTSSPLYPQSNGFIERQVRSIKSHLQKGKADNKTVDDILNSVRKIPIGKEMPSSREILMNRTVGRPGKPAQPIDMENVRNFLIEAKAIQKNQYDRRHRVKDKRKLKTGEEVMLLHQAGHWIKGQVAGRAPEPRSYRLTTEKGGSYRRTRDQIKALDYTGCLTKSDNKPTNEIKGSKTVSFDQTTDDRYTETSFISVPVVSEHAEATDELEAPPSPDPQEEMFQNFFEDILGDPQPGEESDVERDEEEDLEEEEDDVIERPTADNPPEVEEPMQLRERANSLDYNEEKLYEQKMNDQGITKFPKSYYRPRERIKQPMLSKVTQSAQRKKRTSTVTSPDNK